MAAADDVPLLRGENIHLSYGKTRALRGIDVSLAPGEIVAITGKSGSGKSSLLYCLAGILPVDSGRVIFQSRDITVVADSEASELRRSAFGFVFQFGELVPELTIRENVELPLRLNRVKHKERQARAQRLLDALDIAAIGDRRPSQVSGGQAQRAAVARALVHEPRIVFADEPTGSLDRENSALVLKELVELARTIGSAVALVTHEQDVAAIADRTIDIADGRAA